MKYFNNILMILSIPVLMSGCSDMLNYNEVTEYTKEQVFHDFQRVNNYVTNVYSRMEDGLSGYGNGANLSSATDEAEFAWSSSNIHNFYDGVWSSVNPLTNTWANCYWGIRSANFFLENWSNYDFEEFKYNLDYPQQMERYNRYQYEIRFLRAYYYFELVKTYGDVPLITTLLSQEDANKVSRDDKSEVFDFIVRECDEIVDKLPFDYTVLPYAESGRITNLTVMALKARALTYAASPLFRQEGADVKMLWKRAAIANKELLDACKEYGMGLRPYNELSTQNNDKCLEVIYARRLGKLNSFEYNNFPVGVEGGGSGNCPTQTIVDAYRMQATGKYWDEEGSGYNPDKPYVGRDPRFALTIVFNGTTKWPNWNSNPIETFEGGLNGYPLPGATPTGYYLKKYCNPATDLRPGKVNSFRHQWILYRMSEFYLNYAECLAEYFQDPNAVSEEFPESALDVLNELVTYRKMPAYNANTLSEFTRYYRNERMVELAFEGHRFWDVRRWMIGEVFNKVELMKLYNENGNIKYERVIKNRMWDDKMYFFPIPDSEVRKNSNLIQNVGW